MGLRISQPVRNGMADAVGDDFDTTGILEGRSGTIPADAGTAPTGTLLFSITLPADPFTAAAVGVLTKQGTWQDTSADATGTATWFRFKLSGDAGTTNTTDKRLDGTITATGGGGDMQLDSVSITAAQVVTISTGSFTQPAS